MANLDEQLYWACNGKDWAQAIQAAFLLEAGAGTEWRREVADDTAIMQAAREGSLETVTLLFNRAANIHAKSKLCLSGCRSLRASARSGRICLVHECWPLG